MMTIIDYFDHTAIINLPERADRRAETREEFKRVGWQIENKKVDFLRQSDLKSLLYFQVRV